MLARDPIALEPQSAYRMPTKLSHTLPCARRVFAMASHEAEVVLQEPPPAPGARQPHPDGGLARGRHGPSRRHGCGHDAALGQRWRVAHMPAAATTATKMYSLNDSSGRNESASN